jgi:hypothetical protein
MFMGSLVGCLISAADAGQRVEFIALCWLVGSPDIEISSPI